MKTDPLPDLSRTEAAIEEYDKYDESFDPSKMNASDAIAGFAKLEQLGEAVGIAFGTDTSDRNSVSTCKGCIRPGHKVPGPGCELSFVRQAVAKWKNRVAA
jgi:hypothetical protein